MIQIKRIILIITFVLYLVPIGARNTITSFVDIAVGGGWSSLGYSMKTETQPQLQASQGGSYGFHGHVGYGILFTPNIGLAVGVDFARYGAAAKMSGTAVWRGVSDTEGEIYDHHTTVTGWTDKQEMYLIEIPVALHLRYGFSKRLFLFGQVGAKIGLPLISSGHYEGSLRHQGFYEPWMMNLDDVRRHGFYSSAMKNDYGLQTKLTVGAFLKIGIERALDRKKKLWFFADLYATMHFLSAVEERELTDIGWLNDTADPEMLLAHGFMNAYNPVYYTNISSGGVKPLAIGAEIGIRLLIPHISNRCHCMRP